MTLPNDLSYQLLGSLFDQLELPLALVKENTDILFVSNELDRFLRGEQSESASDERAQYLTERWVGRDSLILHAGQQKTALLQNSGTEIELECRISQVGMGYYLVTFTLPEEDESFFHQQRLQTLGLLAGGVAHDFNNILAGILGHITFLQAVLPTEGAHLESLQAITDGAKRASTLTGQILDFSRFQTTSTEEIVDLVSLVRSTSLLLKGALTSTVDLDIQLPDHDLLVRGVEGKLAQILVNLVINARDALSNNGQIVVSVSHENRERDEFCILQVKDNGQGMSDSVLRRAFEPYFSTKGALGTGLGLATVRSIAREHGGVIEIESEQEVGTTVRVLFPSVRSTGGPPEEAGAGNTGLRGGTERVLVVDDEAAVRQVVSMSLTHLGYEVEEFSDSREAQERIQNSGATYDLAVLDMLMPHVSGAELFRLIRASIPSIPVVIMSGYSEEGEINRILSEPRTSFIQKPFTVDQLSTTVRDALDQNGKDP